MIPIRDSTIRNTTPFVNWLIIAANIYVFFLQLTAPDFEQFVMARAFIPTQFEFLNFSSYTSLLWSMFMHGNFFHILSNLWFLHIFGDNVEDEMGHVRYLLFYFAGGIISFFTQYSIVPDATLPLIGASGAISAVAGAYVVLHRHARVETLVPFIIIWTVIDLPAWFVLSYWFVIQLLNGIASLGTPLDQGGIAWFAHIGGFVVGLLLAKSLKRAYA